jgi:hypothetical protein
MTKPRFPGFGCALIAPLLLLTSACGGAASLKLGSTETAASAPPALPSDSMPGAMRADAGAVADNAPVAAPALAAPAPAAPESAPIEAGGAAAQGAPLATAPAREMLDIEANVSLQVASVRRSVKALRELAARTGGVVTAERVDTASQYGSAELTLRVPSRAAQGVFEELEKVGNVLSQTVTARDISKQFFDANLRLSSLTATLQRYQEILSKATKVEEILRIEQELARIRTEIEQVKGDLRWLSDRAARATLHVALREKAPEVVYSSAKPEPEPKFYPGLRAPLLLDFGRREDLLHAGGGVSVRFARSFSLDLDILRRLGSEERGPDAITATAGGELYSDLLGDGQRKFLNPYLGFRAGYGRFDQHHQALVGGTVGLELFKNRWFDLDVETRHYLAFGGERGARYLLVPALSASLAF